MWMKTFPAKKVDAVGVLPSMGSQLVAWEYTGWAPSGGHDTLSCALQCFYFAIYGAGKIVSVAQKSFWKEGNCHIERVSAATTEKKARKTSHKMKPCYLVVTKSGKGTNQKQSRKFCFLDFCCQAALSDRTSIRKKLILTDQIFSFSGRWTWIPKRKNRRWPDQLLRLQVHLFRATDHDGAAAEGVTGDEAGEHTRHQGLVGGMCAARCFPLQYYLVWWNLGCLKSFSSKLHFLVRFLGTEFVPDIRLLMPHTANLASVFSGALFEWQR